MRANKACRFKGLPCTVQSAYVSWEGLKKERN